MCRMEADLSRGSIALRKLLDEGGTYAEAVKAAVHRTQLWRYLNGKSPTVEIAARIERESSGRIPAGWWGEPATSETSPTEAA